MAITATLTELHYLSYFAEYISTREAKPYHPVYWYFLFISKETWSDNEAD